MFKPSSLRYIFRVVSHPSPVTLQRPLQPSTTYIHLFTRSRPSPGLLRSLCTGRAWRGAAEGEGKAAGKVERPAGVGGAPKAKFTGKGRGPVTWVNFVATGVILVIIWAAFEYTKAKKQAKLDKERKKEIGKSKIGGSFELVDQEGKTRTSADFHGKWVLLYFGFTHCPDICPDEMEKLAEVYDNLTAESKKGSNKAVTEPVPLFITVDPERDGVKEVAEYIKEFHPKFIGLTGSAEKIKEACRAFRVYFSAGPRSEDNDYIVDHTIIIYLLDPEGQFVDYYGQTKTSDDITNSVKLQMAKYQSQNSKSLLSSLVN